MIQNSTLTITHSTISNNSAIGAGGILNQNGTATIANSTISGNAALAYGAGGGIFSGGGLAAARMKNTIVAGNKGYLGADIFGAVMSQGHNLIGNSADATGFVDSDLRNVNPNLGPLTGNPAYFPLTADSPAINAGDNVGCPATDEPGTARPQDGMCDIGAVEYLANPPTSTPADASTPTR